MDIPEAAKAAPTIMQSIAALSKDEQATVEALTKRLRPVVKGRPYLGLLALAVVSMELATRQ